MKPLPRMAFYGHSLSCVVGCSWFYGLPYIFLFFSYAIYSKNQLQPTTSPSTRLGKALWDKGLRGLLEGFTVFNPVLPFSLCPSQLDGESGLLNRQSGFLDQAITIAAVMWTLSCG